MAKNLQPTKVAGHKNWWREPTVSENHVGYRHHDSKFKNFCSPYFISKSKYNVPYKYSVLESGAAKSGGAEERGGADTLKEAIKIAEKFEKENMSRICYKG